MELKHNVGLNFKMKVTKAIEEGIKNVGVGKKGSKPCSAELVETICNEVSAQIIDRASLGAFYGALYMKGIEEVERPLITALSPNAESDPQEFVKALFPDAPEHIQEYAVTLLNGGSLSEKDAETLGDYLFAADSDETAKGFFASVLRVKYETIEEYCGLLNAMRSASCDMSRTFTADNPLVQLAEPFDGMNRSYLLTPIIADMLTQRGYTVLSQVGRSAGPKFGTNLLSIATELNEEFINEGTQTTSKEGSYYLTQKDLSPALDSWVETRKSILKRPFLATLEKLVNPCDAELGFFSAFHAPYAEKMVDLALLNGFKKAISVFKSMEGSLGLATSRACQIICGVKKENGEIIKEQFELSPEELGLELFEDAKLDGITPAKNAELIRSFLSQGTSGDQYFDARAQFTIAAYQKVLDWIETV